MSLWSSVGECQKVTFRAVKKRQRGDSSILYRQKAFWCVSNKGPRTDQLPSNYKREKKWIYWTLFLRGTMWLQTEQKQKSLASIQKFELTIPSRFQLFCDRLFHTWQDSRYFFFIRSLVFSLRGRAGRNQSPVMWPVWLWHIASCASSWG